MEKMTLNEMNSVNGGSMAFFLAVLAIDCGLIGAAWGVYMSHKLTHDNPPDFHDIDAITHG
ncbi:hypothetical protein JW835_07185 [bacterium]|nr:hypothetical protein [bacterium]